MGRSVRNQFLTFKLETTSGTSAAPSFTAAGEALLVYAQGLTISISDMLAERDVLRGAFGVADQLPYTRRGNIAFSVDMAGSGAAGTPPAWGKLLQACAFAETVTAGQRVEYTPVSTALKTGTITAVVDGVTETFVYCSGSVKMTLTPGKAPTLDFTFQGLVSDVSVGSNPAIVQTAWIRPLAVGPVGSKKLKLGATYAAGAFSSGTDYSWTDYSLDLANVVTDTVMVGQETITVDNRQPKLSFTTELTAAQVVSWRDTAKAGTATTVALEHGLTAGNIVMVFAAGGVTTGIDDKAQGDKLLNTINMTLPPVSGNDELRIIAK